MNLLRVFALVVALLATSNGYGFTLSPVEAQKTGSWADVVAVGDVDGDGRNDVVLGTARYFDPDNDYKVFVYFQKADGTLDAPKKYPHPGWDNLGLTLADLDRDGRKEIVLGHISGIMILDWSPARKSMSSRSYAPGHQVLGHDLAALDVNRDGNLDVVGQSWSNGATVYLGDGNGGIRRMVPVPAPAGGFHDVKPGDFNGDGHDDFVVVSKYAPGKAYVYYNDGTEYFSKPFEINFAPSTDSTAVGAGDFNGDGRDDLVIAVDFQYLLVYYQGPGGTLQAPVPVTSYWDPNAIVGHDMNLDGRDDAVVLHAGGSVSYYLQGAAGLDEWVHKVGLYATRLNTQGLAVGDINGDACPDIVTANYNAGLVLFKGTDCNGIADLAISIGLTTSGVSLRLDNFGAVEAESPEAIVTLSVHDGTLAMGAMPAECTLQSQAARSARVHCTGAALGAGNSRTLLLPISIGGGDKRTVLNASATATTTTIEQMLVNNRFTRTLRGIAHAPTLAPASRAKGTPTTLKAKKSR